MAEEATALYFKARDCEAPPREQRSAAGEVQEEWCALGGPRPASGEEGFERD